MNISAFSDWSANRQSNATCISTLPDNSIILLLVVSPIYNSLFRDRNWKWILDRSDRRSLQAVPSLATDRIISVTRLNFQQTQTHTWKVSRVMLARWFSRTSRILCASKSPSEIKIFLLTPYTSHICNDCCSSRNYPPSVTLSYVRPPP